MAVHFPIVLLNVGFLAAAWSEFREHSRWTVEAASWLLWLGTASAWAAMGLGLLAEKTAPHVPPAWRALDHHEDCAYWMVGVFTALSLVRWRLRRAAENAASGSGAELGRSYEKPFLAGWFLGCCLLAATAYFGGHLVYSFGMGVNAGN